MGVHEGRRKGESTHEVRTVPALQLTHRPPQHDGSQRRQRLPLLLDDRERLAEPSRRVAVVVAVLGRQLVLGELAVNEAAEVLEAGGGEKVGRLEEGVDERGDGEEEVDREGEGGRRVEGALAARRVVAMPWGLRRLAASRGRTCRLDLSVWAATRDTE